MNFVRRSRQKIAASVSAVIQGRQRVPAADSAAADSGFLLAGRHRFLLP